MKREWKPGDVAICSAAHGPSGDGGRVEYVMARARRGWAIVGDPDYYWSDSGATVIPVRPVAIIDPEDRKSVERLLNLYYVRADGMSSPIEEQLLGDMMFALREFADPKPPKPGEPGTWGVVEAACCHSDERRKWVRHEDGNWWPAEEYGVAEERSQLGRDPRLPDDWSDLIDPAIVREGVQP